MKTQAERASRRRRDGAARYDVFGRGRLGKTLTRALRGGEAAVTLHAGRAIRRTPLGDTVVLLAVPDRAISALSLRIAPQVDRRTVVLHFAGSLGPDALAACRANGAHVGVAHPLVSLASAARSSLADAALVIDGDRRAVKAARALARIAGARPIVRAAHGPSYHAAAALVANGAVALAAGGSRLLRGLGFTAADANRMTAGLLASVADNVRALGPVGALTGPIARGDVTTVERHLVALAPDPSITGLYRALGVELVALAREAGLDEAAAQALLEHLARDRALDLDRDAAARRVRAPDPNVSRSTARSRPRSPRGRASRRG